ncbi:MAG: response regulator [candidate division NC10 bacterium]|nr:response regulator [candidate division NC10 bacterium]
MERKILVAEDSPTQAERVRLLLEGEGYRVELANNGREGLERVRSAPPDLIISDVVMPEMDGYTFCRAVKSAQETRRIPFVLLTERRTPLDILKGLERGADNFITKPFEDEYLLERVRRIFDHLELRKKGQLEVEVAVRVGDRQMVISTDKQQIIELLFANFEEICQLNDQLEDTQKSLEEHARNLEAQVQERTQQLRHQQETLQALYQASLEIQAPLALQERLERLLQTAKTVLSLDRVSILLADPDGQWLQAVATLAVEEPLEAIRVPIGPEGRGLAQAYQTQQMVVWDGRSRVPAPLRLQSPYDRIEAFRSQVFAIAPLVVQGRAIGVLGADRKHNRRPFDPPTRELLQLLAAQAALAIDQARLYEAQRTTAIQLEATVEDRTQELTAANVRLQEASRHKSEFLANMSHELRTPLNSVIGFSELLLDRTVGTLNEKQTRFLTNIQNSGKHLVQLISDILDLSKVEAGKVVLRVEPLPVAMTLEDILVIARGLAHKERQTVETQIDPDLPPLQADPVRFKQILFNLLSNAIKFTPDGGRVIVTARRVPSAESGVRSGVDSTSHVARRTSDPGEFIEIAVADTGIGIKAEDLPRLFQEFMRLEAAATKRYEGTGLGLALTRRLVELHGGRIWAESAGEGLGSTFTLVLPFDGPGEARES